MTPELWERLRPLFNAAVELPPSERAPFIADACGDDAELRREMENLLEAYAQHGASADEITIHLNQLADKVQSKLAPSDVVLGRFKIVRVLGSGGMGDVYKAFDQELGQDVALKSIRPEIVDNQGVLARFKREVQLARRLSGPNICRIHELFIGGGNSSEPISAFLTMEFLEGITLADHLKQSGPISWTNARGIATDICTALTTIHEAGIIHRDLKCRNVMLAERNGFERAVLMDFGLAHEISPLPDDAETALTAPGTFIGTPEYMAPEQFEGKEASPATDIYAMGVVLYEIVTGKHPFAAHNMLEAAVQRGRKLEPASTIQRGVPRWLDQIIRKCLEYDPKCRFQSANELERAIRSGPVLQRLQRIPVALRVGLPAFALLFLSLLLIPAIQERVRGILFSSHEKHIAVLPLSVAGGNANDQALADGLMDDLTGKLSGLDESNQTLWVVPASEVRKLNVTDPSDALRQFGATLVVKGSFERHNQMTRLRLDLIDPKKIREIGQVDVKSETGDLAALQNEAITSLGRLMNVSVKQDSVRGGGESTPRAAYEDYLTGMGYFQRKDKPGNIERAITSLQNAVKTDPNYAIAWAGLAEACTSQYLLTSDKRWLQQAEEYGKRAAELDDRVPSTYVALGYIHEVIGNHDLAINEFQRAIDLDPRNSEALSGLASAYQKAGKNDKAEEAYIKAAAVRPNDWYGYNNLGIFYESIGRPRDAIAQYNRALELTPDNAWVYGNAAMAYMDFDDPEMLNKAEKALKASIALSPTYEAYNNLAYLYMQQHRFAESVTASKEALKINDRDYSVWDNLTAAYEWLKDDKSADAARQKAIELAERTVSINHQDATAQATLAALYARNGAPDKARDKIQIALALSQDNAYVLSQIADAYELLGERAKAIQYLRTALKNGLSAASLNVDPELPSLLRDPHFKVPSA